MSEQLIYTSCKRSIDCASQGMQPWSYSENLPPELNKTMTGMGSYSLNNTPFESISRNPSIYSTYPRAFRYVYTENGEKLFSKSTYIGADWSGTRFGANYISHAVHEELFNGYPIEYVDSPSFLEGIDNEKVSSDQCPEPLPDIDIELREPHLVNPDSVHSFVSENDLSDVKKLLKLAVCSPGKIVISDAADRIPFWIGALTMSLPYSLAEQISFSTFGDMAEFGPVTLVPLYSSENGFRIVSPDTVPENERLDEYCEKAYSDPEFRRNFTAFLEKCNTVKELSKLPEYYLMYLVSLDDGSHRKFCDDTGITSILAEEPKRYGETVLYNNLRNRMTTNPDETVLGMYRQYRDSFQNHDYASELKTVYTELMYARLRTMTDPNTIEHTLNVYSPVVEDRLSLGGAMPMDTPGEIYVALRIWDSTHDEKFSELLSKARAPHNIDVFVTLMSRSGLDLTEYSSPNSVLPHDVSSSLASLLFSNISEMSVEEVQNLIKSVMNSDVFRYQGIFMEICKMPQFWPVVTKCLTTLPYRGQEFTFSDAVNYCLALNQCPYDAILDALIARDEGIDNEQTRDVIIQFNKNIDPMNISGELVKTCRKITDSFEGYENIIDEGQNRIQAIIMFNNASAQNFAPLDNWNYNPGLPETRDYVRRMCQFYSKSRELDDMLNLVNMFPDKKFDVIQTIIGYYMDNRDNFSDPKPFEIITSAALINECPDEITDLMTDLLFNNRKFRPNDVANELHIMCPQKADAFLERYESKKNRSKHPNRGFGSRHAEEPQTNQIRERPTAQEQSNHNSGERSEKKGIRKHLWR